MQAAWGMTRIHAQGSRSVLAGEFETFYFGQNHPMKPHRLAMTHHLVLGYGLHKKMDVYRPRKAYPVELAQFHADDYVEFLSR